MVRHPFLLKVAFLCGSFAGVLSHASSRDAEPQEPDSSIVRQAPSYALDEVVITSSRIPSTVRRSPASVSLISRADIDRSGAIALSDILVAGPGLFIKDYGISSGLKTISQRGLGTEHTLVLLNGMPINSIQNGSLDFGAIPSEEIERVELVPGSSIL
jgi:vitamin B12 transporter